MGVETEIYTNPQRAFEIYRLSEKEIKSIKSYTNEAYKQVDQFIEAFYTWLPIIPEFKDLFSRPNLINQVKKKQSVYWEEFFTCNLNENYIQTRFTVGNVHAAIHLPLSSYIAGMNFAADWWVSKIGEKKMPVKEVTSLIGSVIKLMTMDIALVSSSYMQATHDLIDRQNRTLMDLSTPTIQLWEDILVLPILGVIDSRRALDMTEGMLRKVQTTNALTVIIDITGVPTVDSSVANHLIKIAKATKLMGCDCILSGIGPEIAQTLVHLGINLETLETSANLKSALQLALTKTGYQIKLLAKN